MNHIMHGRQLNVQNYDFTKEELENERFHNNLTQVAEFLNEEKNEINFSTKNQRKRREFSYYYANRDYGDDLEHLQLKKVDNGEFWDNGYR